MAPAPSATTWNSLAGNFVDPSIEVAPTGPVVGLFGFDVIAQFSRRLLQAQMVQSLNQHHVSLLSAFVPWGSIALPDSLLATMSMQFRLTLAVRLARFELRLVNPYIAAFHWPTPVADPIDGGEETTTAAMARVVGRQRTVDIGWQLELNVLTATPGGLNVSSPASPNSRTSSVRSPVTAVWPLEASMGASSPGGASDANWDRFTLATATAITSAVAQLSVPANLWRFGIDLDFSDAVAVVSSDDAAVTDFLATDTGRSMLSQALAELNAAVGIGLTPDIAPAGALSAANVQRMGLQPFHVRDLLLADVKGDPVVSLCAQLGTSTGGVARLVQAFLQNSDFAYCVSTKVLSPGLKTWWSIAATGLAITSTGPVDLPVDGDSNQTAPGQAQVRISFSNVLDDVAIKAATDNRGDPLRLLSKQTVQLLNLWDPNGKRVTDLGDLAQPQTAPFALPMCLFAATGTSPGVIPPNIKEFVVKLMAAIIFPLLGSSFAVGSRSITGFASAASKMLFVRWTLKSPLDDIFTPLSETMTSVQ